jgi:hypothetical protein
MTTTRWILVAALALGLAGSASAASKGTLTPTNNTVAGPGTTPIAASATERVFIHPSNGSDLCVTVTNTGKVPVDVSVTGASSPTGSVSVGATEAVCADDVTQVDLTCAQASDCAAQWRVDSD